MALGDRSDGVLLTKLPGFRKMFPFLMRTRTESVIYYRQRMDLTRTLPWIERFNATTGKKCTLFHVILAASARTLALRPDANRFVVGRRIYQRRTIDLSFVIKRELSETAGETNLKLTFAPATTIGELVSRVSEAAQATRRSGTSADEASCDTLTKLPRSILRLLMAGVRAADYLGLLPASFIRGDSLYTSAYLANLGSIGLDTLYHHMFEWGNAAFFIVVGKAKKEPVVNDRGEIEVRDVVDVSFSLDERITDGVHYAKTIALLTSLAENPERLEEVPTDLPDPFALA
jgi:pyruvate/2-oxoglutarate dehydrogenase complex dihydrolipoamide acyltransferase (E2) component